MSSVKQQAKSYHPARAKNQTAGYTAEQHKAAKDAAKRRKAAHRGKKDYGDHVSGFGTDKERLEYFGEHKMEPALRQPLRGSTNLHDDALVRAKILYIETIVKHPPFEDERARLFQKAKARHEYALTQALDLLKAYPGPQRHARKMLNSTFYRLAKEL